jgi:D-alanyl-D-alanine carboxypeptidase
VVFCAWGAAHARYASIVIEAGSGKVLHAVNADTRNHPASLTKMMTLYMIFDALDSGRLKLDRRLKVSRVAAGRSPSKLGLRRGQSITVRDIIGALVTKSANDAATVAAEALGGTERKFARLMTKKARGLGMYRTVFRNASGLPHFRQLSTARDMATLVAALLRDFPHHYHYFSMREYKVKGRKFRNHNRLLARYKGMDGVKTGYIRASGYNLASSSVRDGNRLIGIIFGGRSVRWRDRHMTWLLNRGYASLTPADATATIAAASAKRDWPPRPGRKPLRIAGRADWSIQVGTFRRFARAHFALSRAARAEPGLIRKPISILSDEGNEGRVYRARLVGLSENVARKSCRRLMRRSISCIVIPTEAAIGQGSR